MRYYYCKFRGYQIVVYTTRWGNAINRLVEFVRVTKGNLGYSEDEIKKDAKGREIDLIDDAGHLTSLGRIEESIRKLRTQYDDKLNEELRKIGKIKKTLREISELIEKEYEEDDLW